MAPGPIPPILVPHTNGKEEIESLPPQEGVFCGRSCSQIVQGTVAFGVFVSVVVFYATNLDGGYHNLTSRSILELTGGAALGWQVFSLLSHQKAIQTKSFISDYATPIFLILSQVYDNLAIEAQLACQKELFGFFNFYGGVAVAAFIHSVVTRKLGEGADVALLDQTERNQEKLKMAYGSAATRALAGGGLLLLGVLGALAGALIPEAKLSRDFGMSLAGNGVARLLSELWWRKALSNYAKSSHSCIASQYTVINRIVLVAFHALPGAFIVAASNAAKLQNPALSSTLYAFTGAFIGWNEHLRQIRFSEVPKEQLFEIPSQKETILPKKPFGWAKWVIGVPGVLTFAGLTIGGYNPIKNQWQRVDPFVVSAIATFSIALYASYFFSEWARTRFSKERNNKLVNSVYYSTHYSIGVPLVFIYVMEKLLINDEAIDLDGPFAGVLTTLAYGSLGIALGKEASSRFSFPNPRVVSSLYFALFGRYFINLISGEFHDISN